MARNNEPPTEIACRNIQFQQRSICVLLQAQNGPCPIIALFNALALRGSVSIACPPTGLVSASTVSNVIATFALQRMESITDVHRREYLMADVVETMPKMWTGLDVNVRFDGVRSYEPTREVGIFEAMGVPLLHGWIFGSDDTAVAEEVAGRSYNVMMEAQIEGNAPFFSAWSTAYASQLTPAGLQRIVDELADDLPVVFFRNNHFATLISHQKTLYTLVTDLGIGRAQPSKPWESLVDVTGVGSTFAALWDPPRRPTPPPAPIPRGVPVESRDIRQGGAQHRERTYEEARYRRMADEADWYICRAL